MRINWKLRLRNKATLAAIVSSTALFVNQLFQIFGYDYADVIKNTVDLVLLLLTVLASVGVLIDPTTEGTDDSEYSLGKSKPTANDTLIFTGDGGQPNDISDGNINE